MRILNVSTRHPLNRLNDAIKKKFIAAQKNAFEREFSTASDLCARVLSDLKIAIRTPAKLGYQPAATLGDRSAKDLIAFFSELLAKNDVPAQAISLHAANLSHRVQLLRAFDQPDAIVEQTCEKIIGVVQGFPRTIEHIRCGRNPGDVLDPYILGAAQLLMCSGDFEQTVSATIAHKVLMIIEGLLGHLHEDVIGTMRGNVRAPEPRGNDQETLDPQINPFPGADIVQPPLESGRPLRFHQVKSKTGSAKGGDGKRLGMQLTELQRFYGGEAFYDCTYRQYAPWASLDGRRPKSRALGRRACRRVRIQRINGKRCRPTASLATLSVLVRCRGEADRLLSRRRRDHDLCGVPAACE